MGYNTISVFEKNDIVTITIERPEVLNAMNFESIVEIDEVLKYVVKGKKVKGLILTGRGEKAFCAGADLKSIQALSSVSYYEFLEESLEVLQTIWTMPIPTVVAINGYALGGGCELALAFDMRIAVPHAKIGLPELALGMLPGWGGVHFMSRIIGRAKTLEFVLTGESVNAEKALEIGLINKIAATESLLFEAEQLIEKINEKGPFAVKLVKQIVNDYQNTDIRKSVIHEALCSMACFTSNDAKTGMDAFINKKKPVFQGK